MPQYLLGVYHPEDSVPPPADLEKVMQDVENLNRELRAAGAWIFAGGLHPSSTASVMRPHGGEVLTSTGPFEQSREPMGGCWIIEASDSAAASEWGRKAALACGLPVEVRPFQGEG
jgi:hypothetical protein